MSTQLGLIPVNIAETESGFWIRSVTGARNEHDWSGAQIEYFHINDWPAVRMAADDAECKVHLFLINLDAGDSGCGDAILLEKFE